MVERSSYQTDEITVAANRFLASDFSSSLIARLPTLFTLPQLTTSYPTKNKFDTAVFSYYTH